MSRSYKLPIIKDRGLKTNEYWRPIRRITKQIVSGYKYRYDDGIYDLQIEEDYNDPIINKIDDNSIMLGTDIPNPKSIINDWDKCDYVLDFRWWESEYITKEEIKKATRK